jgi:hypothetical protein
MFSLIPGAAAVGLALFILAGPAASQTHEHHHPAPADTTSHEMKGMEGMHHDMHGMSGMNMPGMEMSMSGMYGPYAMSREASGTSWQPDAAAHEGIHLMQGKWMLMLHGFGDLVYDHQGGPRGDEKVFSDNMVMGMGQRKIGPGKLGLRAMLSAEPSTIGKDGYPLLLQTGETADGSTHLIDRQHPHDLFMELAGSYSVSSGNRSLFLYGGLPGEPALGPPAFMHRFSGLNMPQAPITHHWLDSSHITFGVVTAGAVLDRVKVEASAFRGREPDQDRWDIESPKLDSHSFRLSVNPTSAWALQVSLGRIKSPEQLEPDVNQDRITASAIHDGSWSGGHWETTLAWGQNRNQPGNRLDAFLAEAAVRVGETHNFFARAERVQKDELFLESDPRAGQIFSVGELTAGYRYDFWRGPHTEMGIGALGTLAIVPDDLRNDYGKGPTSVLVFAHFGLR